MVTHRPQIDETNEEVQQLLEAGMGSIDECIRAIEMYGTAHLATNHMMEIEMEEDEAFSPDGNLQIQREIPIQPVTRFVTCYNNIVSIYIYLKLLQS